MSGTMLTDKIGRKTLCLSACIMMTIGLLLVGILTKCLLSTIGSTLERLMSHSHTNTQFPVFGSGTHMPGVYATIAMIFVFQGSYSFGIAPITQLYPPEVLNYSIRANGMAVWTLVVNLCGSAFFSITSILFNKLKKAIDFSRHWQCQSRWRLLVGRCT